ncbi:uncharacterized protein LOC133337390 [Musca vetustissima]|uniref:uncharacterized protein LOC133337390 n=1 Tax=Musca vetustissima TaxID=27455 RepID=UPI002AB63531|nr:uncharacterized protein LOC133337390 [Musca vetustissima]
MSITIEVNSSQINKDKLDMHFLPANIKGDGEANVEQYFTAYTRKENGFLTNALRGYPLQGETKKVPETFKGIVLQETRKPLDEEAERILRVKGAFKEFTYWNYDKIPSASDGYSQALQIVEIADVMSEPISEKDVLKEMKENESEK